ncbi:MAG: MmcQ/YjbR family DNA-binding protein [Clostridiales bacterium]|jgi:predicted DNA-binding protein (MmcQ/YjbR family)|nr:MmcQ/YjbR family DNA-binding protein [Clostridiales bacterium]
MKYTWLDEYCATKKGAEKEFKEEWNAIRYLIGGKMFAMQGTDNAGRPIVTLKLHPAERDFLRGQYAGIIPGYYMNKEHWNSVYLDGATPDGVLRSMIDKSYDIIFASLTKKAQKEI